MADEKKTNIRKMSFDEPELGAASLMTLETLIEDEMRPDCGAHSSLHRDTATGPKDSKQRAYSPCVSVP